MIFGAAKHLSATSTVNTGTLIGSAEYAAPEQIRGQADFTSDLYSLGITCLHLLTKMSPLEHYLLVGELMWRKIAAMGNDENFLILIKKIEKLVSKALSLAIVIVILVAVCDLGVVLVKQIFAPPYDFLSRTLIDILGLFLNVLIALEVLENISAYLRKHGVQVELVIATSIIAVARKIIILDFEKTSGIELIGLAIAIFSLAISCWIVRRTSIQ